MHLAAALRFLQAAAWPAAVTFGAFLVLAGLPALWRALVPDARARLARANAPLARPQSATVRGTARGPLAPLRRRVGRRLRAAGVEDRLSFAGVLALSVAAAGAGAAWAYVALPVAPALVLGSVAGALMPWVVLGRLATRRRILLDEQLAHLLAVWASTAGSLGTSAEQALRDMLSRGFPRPLSWYLEPVQEELEGAQGLTDRSFVQILDHLDRGLRNRAFHQAREAIEISLNQRIALRESLAMIAESAAETLRLEAQTRANFAYSSASAAALFSFPLLISVVLHLVLPGRLEEAYSRPILGWVMALGIALWCAAGYLFVVGGARRALPFRLEDDEEDDGAGGGGAGRR